MLEPLVVHVDAVVHPEKTKLLQVQERGILNKGVEGKTEEQATLTCFMESICMLNQLPVNEGDLLT